MIIDTLEASADSTSTLSGFHPKQYSGYFSDNNLLHTELPYRTWGESAEPLPYQLWRDDVVSFSLIICMAILVFAFNKTRKQLRQQPSRA